MPAAFAQLKNFIPTAVAAGSPDGLGLLARLKQRLQRARLRESETRIARFIEDSGGRLTDDLERRIERRML